MKLPNKKWMSGVSLAAVSALFVVVICQAWAALNDNRDESSLVAHTHSVLMKLNSIETHLARAESGQRGYLITGNPDYVNRELTAATLDQDVAEVQQLTIDNPVQQKNVALLRPLVKQRMDRLDYVIALCDLHHPEEATLMVGKGKGRLLMAQIRPILDAMELEENRLLISRGQNWRADSQRTREGFVAISATVVILFIALGAGLRREGTRVGEVNTLKRHTEERLNSILESIPDAIYTLDHDLRFTYVNSAAEKLLNMTRDQLLGNTLAIAYTEQLEAQLREQCERVLTEQKPLCFDVHDVPREQHIFLEVTPEPAGLSVTFSETGELKLSDEAEVRLLTLLRHEL